jgi:hypothetical protein
VVLKGNFDPTSGKTKQARVDFIKAYAHALKLQAETSSLGIKPLGRNSIQNMRNPKMQSEMIHDLAFEF